MFAAYAFSGFAGLVYEVTWTRLLTLRLGHTTAAASTVLAAFMGGLAIGAALAGRWSRHRAPREARLAYAALEALVLVLALLLPLLLDALTPFLRWAYADGRAGATFAVARVATSMLALLVPALALGATFPCAVKAVPAGKSAAGRLYALNTCGAAFGSILAGFVLIPAFGIPGATIVAVLASSVSIVLAWTARDAVDPPRVVARATPPRGRQAAEPAVSTGGMAVVWLVVAFTGWATFVLEIGWTRLFALLVGPSAYAFAAVLGLCIAGLAAGAFAGASLARRDETAGRSLAVVLVLAALLTAAGTLVAGSIVPRAIAGEVVAGSRSFLGQMAVGAVWLAAIIVPAMCVLGASFPLALALAERRAASGAASLGAVYAVNTAAAVAGSLAAGFVILPSWGMEGTLRLAAAVLGLAALSTLGLPALTRRWRGVILAGAAIALSAVAVRPPWDRALLASGAYKYGRFVASAADLDVALTAGSLLYYRDGATATVSVRDLGGVRTMSIDGKVDASNGSDMLTQKLLAHLPLLLHDDPKKVGIIGLGSGVTLGAALVHPIESADVVELSPEVVAASDLFGAENRQALSDRRTRLIVGDGRSHLLLAGTRYDVIVSEPSNPWMAGVAALFTREFFAAARDRLAPGGVLCQWAHTYDISSDDLRSIVATFLSVFPDGTMWLIGEGDLLLIGSDGPVVPRLSSVGAHMQRPGVAGDLASVEVHDAFALLSSYVGSGSEMSRYAAGAPLQRDRRMALEFSGPRAVNDPSNDNDPPLLALQAEGRREAGLQAGIDAAPAASWRDRGAMLMRANAFELAFDSYARAVPADPSDLRTLLALLAAAAPGGKVAAAGELLAHAAAEHPEAAALKVALSKWRASTGDVAGALGLAAEACQMPAAPPEACGQLASIYIDTGDADALTSVVLAMVDRYPGHVETLYAQAALQFLRGDLAAARPLGQRVVALDPRRASAWNLLGAVAASMGDTAAARQAFATAVTLEPRDVTTYLNRARFELASGQPAEAVRWFAEALSVDPASQPARDGLAEARAAF